MSRTECESKSKWKTRSICGARTNCSWFAQVRKFKIGCHELCLHSIENIQFDASCHLLCAFSIQHSMPMILRVQRYFVFKATQRGQRWPNGSQWHRNDHGPMVDSVVLGHFLTIIGSQLCILFTDDTTYNNATTRDEGRRTRNRRAGEEAKDAIKECFVTICVITGIWNWIVSFCFPTWHVVTHCVCIKCPATATKYVPTCRRSSRIHKLLPAINCIWANVRQNEVFLHALHLCTLCILCSRGRKTGNEWRSTTHGRSIDGLCRVMRVAQMD